jgi:hypothetical protein
MTFVAPARELRPEERMVWGECPVCKAKHGEPCNSDVGFALGMNVNGKRPSEGAHLGRLQYAPRRVREVAA